MDVVSVNLSRADAAILLRVVERHLGECACVDQAPSRCDRCEALGAIRSDLRVILAARRARVVRPVIEKAPLCPTAVRWDGVLGIDGQPVC